MFVHPTVWSTSCPLPPANVADRVRVSTSNDTSWASSSTWPSMSTSMERFAPVRPPAPPIAAVMVVVEVKRPVASGQGLTVTTVRSVPVMPSTVTSDSATIDASSTVAVIVELERPGPSSDLVVTGALGIVSFVDEVTASAPRLATMKLATISPPRLGWSAAGTDPPKRPNERTRVASAPHRRAARVTAP